jgi:hypothetical protein
MQQNNNDLEHVQTVEEILAQIPTDRLLQAWFVCVLHKGHECQNDQPEFLRQYQRELKRRGLRLAANYATAQAHHEATRSQVATENSVNV